MSLLGRIFQRQVYYISGGLFGGRSTSGPTVTEESALGISALKCGVRVISEAVGSLPPVVYENQDDGGRIRVKDHPVAKLLRNPNPECSRPVLFECLQAHALLYGNAFCEVVRNGKGVPVQLWPIHPTRVQVGRDSDTGRLIYKVTASVSGGPPGTPGAQTVLSSEDVLHVPGLTPDGSVGYSLLQQARNTLGFILATQRYGEALFRNGAAPGGVLNVPANIKLNDDGRDHLRRAFQGTHSGDGVGSVGILENGITWTESNLASNRQLQYQELLSFFTAEIGRLLNVTPTKLHDLSRATWANLETLNQDFLTTTLRPWLEKWEAEFERKLLLPAEQDQFCIDFDTTQLLRADQASRYAAYATAGVTGWLSINEVRASEELPPVDGGDELPGLAPPPPPPPAPLPPMLQQPDQPTDQPATDTADQEQDQEGTASE